MLRVPDTYHRAIAAHLDVAVDECRGLYESGLGLGVSFMCMRSPKLWKSPLKSVDRWESGNTGVGRGVLNSYLEGKAPETARRWATSCCGCRQPRRRPRMWIRTRC